MKLPVVLKAGDRGSHVQEPQDKRQRQGTTVPPSPYVKTGGDRADLPVGTAGQVPQTLWHHVQMNKRPTGQFLVGSCSMGT